jgi:hypothetical protein
VSTGDGGLATILGTLRHRDVDAFLDSGVLLGMVRGGSLNAWEKDIDLGVLDDQLDALLAAAPALETLGYRVAVNRYRGTVFSVGLKPEAASVGALRCSVHVYYCVGQTLWSPQVELYQPPPTPDVFPGRRSAVGRCLRSLIDRWFEPPPADAPRSSRIASRKVGGYRLARAFYRRVDRGWLAETWPTREIYVPFTWVIPARLVVPLGELDVDGVTYRVPGDLDGYLTLRYGDWRTPVRDWCYWEDDGALVREPPLRVRAELARGHGDLQSRAHRRHRRGWTE